MAVVVAGSSVTVSALLSNNLCPAAAPWGSASSNGGRMRVSALGESRIRARLAVERSGFLGDSVYGWDGECSSVCELGFERNDSVDWQMSVRAGFQGRGGGRVFFLPFGPPGRAGGRGTQARREWERRQRAQQERFREMLEREIKARTEERTGERNKTRSSYEFSLLRELEKRLRAEEVASRNDSSDGEDGQQQSPKAEEEGPTIGLGASTYELMKELEKRLRTERESQRVTQQSAREGRRTEREGRDLKTGDFSSLYDYMRELDREMREQRANLEEQWRTREEGREIDRNREERFRGQRRRPESGRRTAAETREKVVEDESSKSTPTAAAIGSEYAQSNGTVIYLKNEANGAEIYLVGASHVSQKSVDEVKDVIERVKPDFVMVELCRKRYENMDRQASMDKSQRESPMPFIEQMVRMLTNGNVGVMGKIIGIGLSSFYKLLSYRGFHPGKEFQVAIEEGKKVGAKIVLGDQDIDTTLKQMGRFNLNMSVEDTFKFFGQRMPEDLAQSIGGKHAFDQDMFERMRDRKVVRRFNEEMEKGAPAIYKALVSDRNEVMVNALSNLTGKVVAVVGLAHIDGMEKLWQQANERYFSGQSNQTEE